MKAFFLAAFLALLGLWGYLHVIATVNPALFGVAVVGLFPIALATEVLALRKLSARKWSTAITAVIASNLVFCCAGLINIGFPMSVGLMLFLPAVYVGWHFAESAHIRFRSVILFQIIQIVLAAWAGQVLSIL